MEYKDVPNKTKGYQPNGNVDIVQIQKIKCKRKGWNNYKYKERKLGQI
jgi:hypothetical protein